MHQKEIVLTPILSNNLGLVCFTEKQFNTDIFGTFSGEIERTTNPIETARLKCALAFQCYEYDIAIASEGSFGAHPSIPFIPANEEILLFIDKKNKLEIAIREISIHTNFNIQTIHSYEALTAFAHAAKFPSHALILKSALQPTIHLYKGITSWEELKNKYEILSQIDDTIIVETDMRALFNPTRMEVIKQTAEKLVKKIQSLCPSCNTPGFGVVSSKKGLPCASCHFPTRSTLSHLYQCAACNHTEEKMYPFNIHVENPMYCDFCNP